MALNKREKLLAYLTVPLVLTAGWILFSSWWGPLKALRQQRDDLSAEVERDERRVQVARKAQARLDEWNRRSLPADLKIAASEYHGWLFRLATEAGFEKPDVNVTTSMADRRRQTGAFRTLRFSVRGRAKLEDLTEFLFRFDSAHLLHRMRNVTINPAQGSDKLDVSFVIEALSLPDAATVAIDVNEGTFDTTVRVTPGLRREMIYTGKEGKLVDAAKFRLAGFRGAADFDFSRGKSLEEVKTSINQKTRTTGVTASVEGDKLTLRREAADSAEASGQLASSEISEYREAIVERNVFAPYKEPRREPQKGPEPPPPPKFDPAKFARVTGIVRGVNGRQKAFVIAHTTGQTFELTEGDTFDVGDVHAKVVHINRRDAEIEFDGKRWLVPLGDNLREAKPLFEEPEEEKERAEEEETDADKAEPQEPDQQETKQDDADQQKPAEEAVAGQEEAKQESDQPEPTPEMADPQEPDPEEAKQDEPRTDESDQEQPAQPEPSAS